MTRTHSKPRRFAMVATMQNAGVFSLKGEMMGAPAYDYDKQCWVTDPAEASALHLKHLRDERELVAGPRGPSYLQSIGASESVEQVLTRIDRQISGVR